MKHITLAAGAMLASAAFLSSAANAAVTVNFSQVGSNVVATASGSLNLTGLTALSGYSLDKGVNPAIAYVGVGSAASVTAYSGLTGPNTFGSGNYTLASSVSGTGFALNATSFGSPYAFVPIGYVSGSAISGTDTFLNQTFASLGLTAGQYVFSSRNDSVTINIGAGADPEPATWAMMLLGFGGIGAEVRRQRKTKLALA